MLVRLHRSSLHINLTNVLSLTLIWETREHELCADAWTSLIGIMQAANHRVTLHVQKAFFYAVPLCAPAAAPAAGMHIQSMYMAAKAKKACAACSRGGKSLPMLHTKHTYRLQLNTRRPFTAQPAMVEAGHMAGLVTRMPKAARAAQGCSISTPVFYTISPRMLRHSF